MALEIWSTINAIITTGESNQRCRRAAFSRCKWSVNYKERFLVKWDRFIFGVSDYTLPATKNSVRILKARIDSCGDILDFHGNIMFVATWDLIIFTGQVYHQTSLTCCRGNQLIRFLPCVFLLGYPGPALRPRPVSATPSCGRVGPAAPYPTRVGDLWPSAAEMGVMRKTPHDEGRGQTGQTKNEMVYEERKRGVRLKKTLLL